MVVIDRDGVEHEIGDDEPIPPGCALRVPISQAFRDSVDGMRKRVMAERRDEEHADDDDELTDAEHEDADDVDDVGDGDDDDDDDGDGGDELTDEELAEQRRQDAYADYRASLDYRSRRRKLPRPTDPPSQRMGKERGLDAAPTADEAVKAGREAYARRGAYLRDAWRINRDRRRGPWLQTADAARKFTTTKPQWSAAAGGAPPSVGPTGRSPYSGTHQDARAQAYARYVERISTAYLKNRRPFTPGPEGA
jgi:hypothetical protein